MQHLFSGCLVALSLLPLTGCSPDPRTVVIDFEDRVHDAELKTMSSTPRNGQAFFFGFDLRASPQEDARQYLPLLDYLEQATGYRFELRFTPKNRQVADELGAGRIHFAAIGATSYVRAREQYGAIALVRGLNYNNKAEYRSMIVVRPDSPLRRVGDLRGKRVAFGDFDSTQGHLIPRIVLRTHGIGIRDLGGYAYTGSHRNCANAVVVARFDACGMQDTMAQSLAGEGLLRILYTSDYYPSSGIAANQDVPAEVRKKVLQALLDFDPEGRHKAALYNWDKTEMPKGFVAAREEDYAGLRQWLIKFRLMAATGTAGKSGAGS